MARLIVKSPYFKGGSAKPAGGYLRYIATRERVEILPDDRPPTKRQTQLIEKAHERFSGYENASGIRRLCGTSDKVQRLTVSHAGDGGKLGQGAGDRRLRKVHCNQTSRGADGGTRAVR